MASLCGIASENLAGIEGSAYSEVNTLGYQLSVPLLIAVIHSCFLTNRYHSDAKRTKVAKTADSGCQAFQDTLKSDLQIPVPGGRRRGAAARYKSTNGPRDPGLCKYHPDSASTELICTPSQSQLAI